MTRVWRWISAAAATVTGAAALARVGLLVMWAVLGAVVVVTLAWCWTVASEVRARNAAVVLGAVSGHRPEMAAASVPEGRMRRRWWQKNRQEEGVRG